MAKKKQEVQLMREIESQEEWEDIMTKDGVWVIDVFQEWSGPCDAMVSNFRRIKNELGDDLLHFAMAKADTIDTLEKYRGSCEPCFLFFAGGVLVAYVHGANAPLILRTLTEQLAQEHKVVDGAAERKEVKDPFAADRAAAENALKEEEEEEDDSEGHVPHRRVSTLPQDYEEGDQKFQYNGEVVIYGDDLAPADAYEEVPEGYTVAIIKPNVVEAGKVDEILAEMKAKGIQVLAQEERQLTEDEAREFYSHLKDEEYFDELVSFMSGGPSHVLVLTKGQADDSIIKDWRDMLGPPVVQDAQEQEPESLRARYGAGGLMNALHGSDSKEAAARELAFFFPQMNAPKMQVKKKEVQRTLALIRPDAFASNREAILEKIKESGFQIALQKEVLLTKEQAEEFYQEHAGQPYFEELTTRMSSGPLLALGLAREDAVDNWRVLLGPPDLEEAKTAAPDSLRAQFAITDSPINPLHGSDSVETAKKELEFFFPMEQTVAMIKPDAYGTKDTIVDRIHEAGFRIAARKETTITREIAESFYEDQKDKEYFNDLVEHMISGPTMFMVLSREGAVEGWRQEIGPTDPTQAKEEAPSSLRAQFGTDILHNAVHGCSTREQAQQKIEKMFGQLAFNPDGTVQGGDIQQEQEEQPVSGSPVPQPADVAPEYKEQAEQQEQQEGESEQQPEQQDQAEEKQEGEAEQQPAETQEEGAEKTEGEEQPAEQAQEGAVAENTESEQKPSEEKEEGAEKPEDEQKPSDAEEEADVEAESSHSGIDLEAGLAAQQADAEKPADTAGDQQDTQQAAQEETPAEPEQKPAEPEEKPAEPEEKPAEPEQKPAESEEKPAEEAKPEEQKEDPKEEQKDGGQAEEPKAEEKEGKADDKAAEEAKTEGTEQKTDAAAAN